MTEASRRVHQPRHKVTPQPDQGRPQRFVRCRSGCGYLCEVREAVCANCGLRGPSASAGWIDWSTKYGLPLVCSAASTMVCMSVGDSTPALVAMLGRVTHTVLCAAFWGACGALIGLQSIKDETSPQRRSMTILGAVVGGIIGAVGSINHDVFVTPENGTQIGGFLVGGLFGAAAGLYRRCQLNARVPGGLVEHEQRIQRERTDLAAYARQLLDIRKQLAPTDRHLVEIIDVTYERASAKKCVKADQAARGISLSETFGTSLPLMNW